MNDLQKTNSGLPATPQELAPFVAVGTAAVNAARQMLKSGKLTKEQFQKVLVKGQEQAVLVLGAKEEMGKIIVNAPSENGKRTDLAPSGSEVGKTAAYTDLNITKKQADNYQLIAKHPRAVEKAAVIARENNDIPTESLVLQIIRQEQAEAKPAKPQKEDRHRTWNFVYQSRLSYANEDPNVAEVIEMANEFDTDEERAEFFDGLESMIKRVKKEWDGYA